ncbi:MAG: Sarcosine oxidase subunit alpha [Alphaproteobacteria bacterium UBA4588]|nr:MAG: Sarcosine oxidase subunit alpha [Alphaproteobacteria bacterium UBA4588]
MTGSRFASGGLIDRKKPITFQYDGMPVQGFAGDTIASALMASGHQIVGRSFKYHRPRGINSAGPEESGALFTVGDNANRTPNVKGTIAEIHDGLIVRSQNAFPNVRYDLGAVNSLIAPFLTAGFYYKTFVGPFSGTRFWMIFEYFIRKAAGLGVASRDADPATYDIAHHHCDILVVGAGPSGLWTAVQLAEAGQSVMLVEQDFACGGQLLSRNNARDAAFIAEMQSRLTRAGGQIMIRTTAFGLYDGLVTGLVERVTDHLSAPHESLPREIFHIVRPQQIVLASGALERGLAFGNNDRPGVMLAHAIARYAGRFGVSAGQSCIMATSHDGTYDDALQLAEAGMKICVLDARPCYTDAQEAAKRVGLDIMFETVPVQVAGGRGVAGLEVGMCDSDGLVHSDNRMIGADVIGMSGGYSPVVNLLSHRGVKPVWDADIQAFRSGPTTEAIHVVGSADGFYDNEACLASADVAVSHILRPRRRDAETEIFRGWQTPAMPLFEINIQGRSLKSFIDPQHDVTTADIRQAHSEGFVSVEHMKRYTTLGMATDQGRMGNILGLATMAEARNMPIAESGITTFRPPFTPVSIGVLAGRSSGSDWWPTRRTPMHDAHLATGAVMMDVGYWKRAWYYPQNGETMDEAYIREAAIVRQTVGMVDVSTLGKIAIQGPDATEFLNQIYINAFAKLPVGKARYGIMLRDDGHVMDDGTTWRLSDDEYFMTTTTAQAGPVMLFLEELLQTRMTNLEVHVSSVSDYWAGIAVAGPLARQVLTGALPALDWSNNAFPFMGVQSAELKLGGAVIPFRAARISFSGERAWEIYVPADFGNAVWVHLAEHVALAGGSPYGMESLGTLRIEKGHVTGAELDGRVTLEDAGFAKMASKTKPYIGSVLRKRSGLMDESRPRLVGIFPKEKNKSFGTGAILCEPGAVSGFGKGWVTAVTHSPALGHWIGLGFVSGGYEAWKGKTVMIADPVRGATIEGEIVSPHMFDPDGGRQNG